MCFANIRNRWLLQCTWPYCTWKTQFKSTHERFPLKWHEFQVKLSGSKIQGLNDPGTYQRFDVLAVFIGSRIYLFNFASLYSSRIDSLDISNVKFAVVYSQIWDTRTKYAESVIIVDVGPFQAFSACRIINSDRCASCMNAFVLHFFRLCVFI